MSGGGQINIVRDDFQNDIGKGLPVGQCDSYTSGSGQMSTAIQIDPTCECGGLFVRHRPWPSEVDGGAKAQSKGGRPLREPQSGVEVRVGVGGGGGRAEPRRGSGRTLALSHTQSWRQPSPD